jgi:hypothetical protein
MCDGLSPSMYKALLNTGLECARYVSNLEYTVMVLEMPTIAMQVWGCNGHGGVVPAFISDPYIYTHSHCTEGKRLRRFLLVALWAYAGCLLIL